MTQSTTGWHGGRITTLRERLGSVTRPLSRRDLTRLANARVAPAARISESMLQRYELGEAEPGFSVVVALAALAGVPVADFASAEQAEELDDLSARGTIAREQAKRPARGHDATRRRRGA